MEATEATNSQPTRHIIIIGESKAKDYTGGL